MNYAEAIDFLFTSLPMFQRIGGAAYKANLDNTNHLDSYFGRPHRKFHTIHVAGTNGKGSTCHMLAAILQSAGYKTGLYTSPHLLDFRERIKIDGVMIPEQDVVDFVEKHQPVIRKVKPSFFEMTVALAFDYFARQDVDVAVIEVGMGGRLDSTNIITPLLSIITNISHDHGQFLGNTLEEIAGEKAGIIKPGVPVVIGETQPESAPVFNRVALENQAPIVFADWHYQTCYTGKVDGGIEFGVLNRLNGQNNKYTVDLSGFYQGKNVQTVLTAIDVLNEQQTLKIDSQAVHKGLRDAAHTTGLFGRWQYLSETPLIVADTGHNVGGIREVVFQMLQYECQRLYFVFGVVGDKDLDKIWPLLPKNAYYIFTQASIERAMDAKTLAQQAGLHGFSGEVISDIPAAVEKALQLAGPDDMIFIGGSTFTVAEALPLFKKE